MRGLGSSDEDGLDGEEKKRKGWKTRPGERGLYGLRVGSLGGGGGVSEDCLFGTRVLHNFLCRAGEWGRCTDHSALARMTQVFGM